MGNSKSKYNFSSNIWFNYINHEWITGYFYYILNNIELLFNEYLFKAFIRNPKLSFLTIGTGLGLTYIMNPFDFWLMSNSSVEEIIPKETK
jgi:hypothetical protein